MSRSLSSVLEDIILFKLLSKIAINSFIPVTIINTTSIWFPAKMSNLWHFLKGIANELDDIRNSLYYLLSLSILANIVYCMQSTAWASSSFSFVDYFLSSFSAFIFSNCSKNSSTPFQNVFLSYIVPDSIFSSTNKRDSISHHLSSVCLQDLKSMS